MKPDLGREPDLPAKDNTLPPSPAALFALAATPTTLLIAQPHAHGTVSTKRFLSVSTKHSGQRLGSSSALPGREKRVVTVPITTLTTSVSAAEPSPMGPRDALELRQCEPLTPYKIEAWTKELQSAGLLPCFAKILLSLKEGFILKFPHISHIQLPPNKPSIATYQSEFDAIIQRELTKSRYIGPFPASTLLTLIGPFQSSPLLIIPKPGKPGKFRLTQNFSFPHNLNPPFTNPSVNLFINAADFPTTWGKFSIIYLLISRLPPNSKAAMCGITEAYRTILLHPSEWPTAVVHITDNEFYIDTCTVFRTMSLAGIYGHLADVGAEIL
jgi:hypothetical protein